MRCAATLLLLLSLVLPTAGLAQAIDTVGIDISDTPQPAAATYGIDSMRFPHVEFRGSDPKIITQLLQGISSPLGTGMQKDILAALLMMPVYPDSVDAVPEHWFVIRQEKLLRIGAYEEALRLSASLPEALQSDATARRFVDAALTVGDVETACKQVDSRLKNPSTTIDGYWSLRQIFCQQYAKNDAQAELMLGIFHEQYPEQQALATALLEGWGNAKAVLPPLTSADAESYPLLVAAMVKAKTSHAEERITAGFVMEKEVPGLPPAVAAALAARDVFPLSLRLVLASRAVAGGAADAAMLRALLEQVKPSDVLPEALRKQALLIADINATQSNDNKVSTVANALLAFKRFYTPYIARALVSKELDSFSRMLGSYPLTPELALDLTAYQLEREKVAEAVAVKNYLERYAAGNEALGIVLGNVREAIAVHKLLHGEAENWPEIGEFTTGQRPSLMWMLHRLVLVRQALKQDVPFATTSLSASAPLADTLSTDSAVMIALEQAENGKRGGEVILRILQLLADGKLAFVSDEVFARCIGALMKLQLDTYALTLAEAALLNPSVAPLSTGGPVTAKVQP